MWPWWTKKLLLHRLCAVFALVLRSVGLSPAESPVASTQITRPQNRGVVRMWPKYEMGCCKQFQSPALPKWGWLKMTAVPRVAVITGINNPKKTWSNSCCVQVLLVFQTVTQSARPGSSLWQPGCHRSDGTESKIKPLHLAGLFWDAAHREKNKSGSGKQDLEQGQKVVWCAQDLRHHRGTQCACVEGSHGVHVIKDNQMQKVRVSEKRVLGEKRFLLKSTFCQIQLLQIIH